MIDTALGSQDQFRALFEAAPDAMAIVEQPGGMAGIPALACNDNCEAS
jgi:hypothetical protein